MNAPTDNTQLSYKQKTVGKQCFAFCKLATRPQFSIFNFQFYIYLNLPLGHNMFFDITNCLHELGTAARRQFKSTSAIALPNRLPE